MKPLLLYLLLLAAAPAIAQTDPAALLAESRKFQQELDADYRNKEKSPLEPADLQKFTGHDFFPISADYIIPAKLVVTEQEPVFKMPTSTARLVDYRKYGELVFTFQGKTHRLNVYQSQDLLTKPGYEDYLFLPFTDQTTGRQTYVGGRYLGLRIPASGNDIMVDFNQAYNPYCAYSSRYSCPRVPKENHLEMEVPAGVRYSKKQQGH